MSATRHIVLIDGSLYSMSKRSYRKYLNDSLKGEAGSLDAYGKWIGDVSINMGRANDDDIKAALAALEA